MTGWKHAVLDLDGTLIPGILGAQYLSDLVEDGTCHREAGLACLRAIERLAAKQTTRSAGMPESYRHYAAALAGKPCADVRTTAIRTWRTCRRSLFPFAEELIGLLTGRGFRVHLVSGNGDLPIQEAVADLGLSWGRGTLTEIVDGRFTERLTCVPGLPGGKAAVMREIVAREGFDRGSAIAIGNSGTDAEILSQVGHAIAFEPDASLRESARRHDWHIVDRDTVLSTCARLADEPRRR